MKAKLTNKEISWLSFNARVLQEAADPTVPLLERMKFLGIFSSNLDEFFRVRVATLRRLSHIGKKAKKVVGHDPKKVLKDIRDIAIAQNEQFDSVYKQLLKELAKERIFIIDDKQLTAEQGQFVTSYFRKEVRPQLMPIMVDDSSTFPALRDDSIYLAVCFAQDNGSSKNRYALIEVPRDGLQRFLILPSVRGDQYIVLMDDIIRHSIEEIFSLFRITSFEAYSIKLTRDAELDIDNDISESYIRKVSKSVKQRKEGDPVRFVYDAQISEPLLSFLTKKLRLSKEDALIPGARYHNFKDFMNFPRVGSSSLRHVPRAPTPHKDIDPSKSLLATIAKRDILLHFPYQSFDSVLALLREAAIDPGVRSIKVTLYRIARHSGVVSTLINAIRNGKDVTAVVELQARFDEEANILLANRLQEEGAHVIYGVPGLKVHGKLCLITRRQKRKEVLYACIGTGNFNEDTSPIYSDHCLLTADKRLTAEVKSVFDFMENKFRLSDYKHLIVSPFNARKKYTKLIRNEIRNARKGKEAFIFLKLNHLADTEMIRLLYQASAAGVKVKLIVRGMFSLIPGIPKLSENIEAIGIVDRFLEHSRILAFCNDGSPKYFLTSGDWMTRNLDRRIEVTAPIYDGSIQEELRAFLDTQWNDNVKARILNKELDNQYRQTPSPEKIRAQVDFYELLKELHTATPGQAERLSRTAS
jgi:polyphosphate kinase